MSHSRNWCPNRKASVPADGRRGDLCPVCGLPFDEARADLSAPIPEPSQTPAPTLEPELAPEPAPAFEPGPFDVAHNPSETRSEQPTQPPAATPPPPGWYPDPAGVPGRQRWWDGSAWSTRTRSSAAGVTSPGAGWHWKHLLFSFNGRAHRAHYWGGGAMLIAVFFIFLLITGLAVDSSGGDAIGGLLFVGLFVFYVWAGLALSVKRWHDRNKSGVWMLISFIPFIGPVWSFIELGLLEGTIGPNSFGEDPVRRG